VGCVRVCLCLWCSCMVPPTCVGMSIEVGGQGGGRQRRRENMNVYRSLYVYVFQAAIVLRLTLASF
jgi:hypothetical protein